MSVRRLLAGAAVAGLALVGLAPAATGDAQVPVDTEVFISPAGDDEADGSAEQPLRTLTGAVSVLAQSDVEDATVWVEPGTYYEPAQVSWQVPQASVTSRPVDAEDRPAFDGSQATGGSHYWMNTAGGPSLDIEGIEVRNYRTGGIRMDTDGNVIHDLVFHQIGNRHVPEGPGYGALHMLDSSNNRITDVAFRDLENVD